jgi:hypothetical protein
MLVIMEKWMESEKMSKNIKTLVRWGSVQKEKKLGNWENGWKVGNGWGIGKCQESGKWLEVGK